MRNALALAALLTAAACNRQPSPNVVVIVVDTLRADRLGVYGNQRGLTPFLDEVAQHGTVFTNAFSTSSWTSPAVASLMTSRDPLQHLVSTFGTRLSAEERTFAEVLHARGYRTGGFSANPRLRESLGYAQGFEHWRSAPSRGDLSAGTLRAQGLEWLDASNSAHPTLLYFQFMEPHFPYRPAEPFRSRFMTPPMTDEELEAAFVRLVGPHTEAGRRAWAQIMGQLYDGEVATIDQELRVLFDQLARRRFLDGAIVVITADHGEEFFEHGGSFHGRTLFNECVRVPFILIAPGYMGGRLIDDNVSLLDVAPTLIDLLGLPSEPRFEGQSLVPFLEPESIVVRAWARLRQRQPVPAPRDLLLRLEPMALGGDQRAHSEGILRGTDKLVVRLDGARDIFDLRADAAEEHPNPAGSERQADLFVQALQRQTRILQGRATVAVEVEVIDDATKEQLRALGYGD